MNMTRNADKGLPSSIRVRFIPYGAAMDSDERGVCPGRTLLGGHPIG